MKIYLLRLIIILLCLLVLIGCQQTQPAISPQTEALTRAAREGHADTVRSLLSDPKTDVNARDQRGATALIEAARFGHNDVVRSLLNGNANVNAKDNEGKTALMYAVHGGHDDVTRLLKQAGAAE